MCSDEVLKVSYSADGIDFVVQNVYTMGKSPGGLSGHAAALLHDQSGTLQDGPKCTSTRMIISGGTNTDRIKKNKIKGKYSSEGAAREWKHCSYRHSDFY